MESEPLSSFVSDPSEDKVAAHLKKLQTKKTEVKSILKKPHEEPVVVEPPKKDNFTATKQMGSKKMQSQNQY